MSGTTRQVTVVINGEEYVSTAAKQAEAGITLFGKRIPFVLDATKLLEMGLNAMRAAFGAAKDFVLNSIAAYDSFSASQRKLEGTAKLSGIAIEKLQDVADTGRKAFGLAAGTSNEFAAEIGKLTSKSGDITKSKDAMGAFLDIGAARGLSAAETLKAVQQAVLGIDEGTDKLFSKNPSVLYQEYADKVGKSASKLTDQEKAQALLDATMTGGERVRGAYLDYLNSAAGQQEQANNKMTEAQVAFGAAIQPIRTLVLQGLNRLLDVLGPTVKWLGETANLAGVTIVQSFNRMRETVGTVAQTLGRMTGNRDLEEWGRRTADAARESMASVEATVRRASQTTKAATQESTTAVTTAHRQMATAAKESSEISQEAADAYYEKASAKLGKPLAQTIGLTEGAIASLGRAATEQLPTAAAEQFSGHMRTLAERAEESRQRMLGIKSEADGAKGNTKGVADNMRGVAEEALKAAGEFGVIDENAGRSLESAKRIFGTLGDIAKSGFSFTGAVGLIGGVASLVNTMMNGDGDRRRLLRENNDALIRMTRELDGLKLNLSGEDYANVGGALSTMFDTIRKNPGSIPALMGAVGGFQQRLTDLGLTPADIKRIADVYGIQVFDKRGDFLLDGLEQLMQAMSRRGPGQVGQGFGDQLQFFRDTQRASGATGLNQISGLLTFLRDVGGVRALDGIDFTNPDAIRDALFAIRTQFNNGGLSGERLGRLSGGAFNDIILEILGMLSSGGAAPTGGSTAGGASEPPAGGSGAGGTASAPQVPEETIQSVIRAMDQRMLSVLSSHTPLFDRIAVATEKSAASLASIDGKMDQLIVVTAGQIEATDAKLEAMRRMAALERGQRPEFG